MNRRDFLVTSSAAAAVTVILPGARAAEPDITELLAEMIRANDAQIPRLLAKQARGVGQRWRGGIANEDGIFTAGGVSGFISALACAATSPGGKYNGGAELVEPLRLAIANLRQLQHDDGTID